MQYNTSIKLALRGSNQMKVKRGSMSVSITSHSLPRDSEVLEEEDAATGAESRHGRPLCANSKHMHLFYFHTELIAALKMFSFLKHWELRFKVDGSHCDEVLRQAMKS